MFNIPRHSLHRLRLWLIAAAAILFLTSVLEAGHIHGVFIAGDDHCTLCHHSIALDKFLTNQIQVVTPLLLAIVTFIVHAGTIDRRCLHFALIRAPPKAHHRR